MEAELLKTDRNLNSYASVRLSEAEKGDASFSMYVRKLQTLCAFAWKSETLDQVLASIKSMTCIFVSLGMIREFFQNSSMIDMVFLQNGMIREFFQNSSMIDMVFLQNGMIREFLNNHNMGMIVLMIFGMNAEPLNNHNMGMIVFLNSNSVVN